MNSNSNYMDVRMASEYLHVARSTIYKWVEDLYIPHKKLRKRVLFIKDDIDEKEIFDIIKIYYPEGFSIISTYQEKDQIVKDVDIIKDSDSIVTLKFKLLKCKEKIRFVIFSEVLGISDNNKKIPLLEAKTRIKNLKKIKFQTSPLEKWRQPLIINVISFFILLLLSTVGFGIIAYIRGSTGLEFLKSVLMTLAILFPSTLVIYSIWRRRF